MSALTMLADQFQLQVHRNDAVRCRCTSSALVGLNVLMKLASPAEPGPGVSVGLTSISGISASEWMTFISHVGWCVPCLTRPG